MSLRNEGFAQEAQASEDVLMEQYVTEAREHIVEHLKNVHDNIANITDANFLLQDKSDEIDVYEQLIDELMDAQSSFLAAMRIFNAYRNKFVPDLVEQIDQMSLHYQDKLDDLQKFIHEREKVKLNLIKKYESIFQFKNTRLLEGLDDVNILLFELVGEDNRVYSRRYDIQVEEEGDALDAYLAESQAIVEAQAQKRKNIIADLKKQFKDVLKHPAPWLRGSSYDVNSITLEEVIDASGNIAGKRYNINNAIQLNELQNKLLQLRAKNIKYIRPARLISDLVTVNEVVRCLQDGQVDGRVFKNDPRIKDLNLDYTLYKWGGRIYAIDRGVKVNNLIGEGAFGTVKRVQLIQDPFTEAALKIQIVASTNLAEIERIKNEFEIIQYLHPEFSSGTSGPIFRKNKKGLDQIEFIMPLARGRELREYLIDHLDNLSAVERSELALAILKAYKKISDKGVLHRDIKFENIFYDPVTKTVTFLDFGFARRLPPGTTQIASSRTPPYGTLGFIAPEYYDENSPRARTAFAESPVFTYSIKSDLYALGVITANILVPNEIDAAADRVYDKAVLTYHPIPLTKTDANKDRKIALVNHMMHKNLAERADNLDELIQELEQINNNELQVITATNSQSTVSLANHSASLFKHKIEAIPPAAPAPVPTPSAESSVAQTVMASRPSPK